MNIPKKPLFSKIALIISILLFVIACKKAYTTPNQSNTGRMLQVELKMPEPWKKIVIGPVHSIEYPNAPRRFSMFMTGESTGALKPYLIIEDSKGDEYSILLAMTTGNYSGGGDLSVTHN